MIAASTSASCTLSLTLVGRSLKGFWRGSTQAPDNPALIVQTKMTKEKVLQCILRERSVLLKSEEVRRRKEKEEKEEEEEAEE